MTRSLGPFQRAVLVGLASLSKVGQGLELTNKFHTRTIARAAHLLSNSATYNALRQLERRGLVKSRLETEGRKERGARRRRCFKLTAAGRKVLRIK